MFFVSEPCACLIYALPKYQNSDFGDNSVMLVIRLVFNSQTLACLLKLNDQHNIGSLLQVTPHSILDMLTNLLKVKPAREYPIGPLAT